MGQLISVRTNTYFSLNYETKKLEPKLELIILIGKPVYEVDNKKERIIKNAGISETRVTTTPEGLANLIGELQALQNYASQITNMSHAFNAVINAEVERASKSEEAK